MREIKFRGWDKVHNEMYYNLCSSEQKHTLIWVLQQYTGLKDKNGKEIYEGDILHCIDEIDGKTERVGYVVFERASFWVNYLPEYFTDDDIMDEDIEYEVIGNAFENHDKYKWNPYKYFLTN